jgi:hypothetical protein
MRCAVTETIAALLQTYLGNDIEVKLGRRKEVRHGGINMREMCWT